MRDFWRLIRGPVVASPSALLLRLPGSRRSQAVAAGAGFVVAMCLAVCCWPLPAALQGPLAGTPVLFDVRGREIAELPSDQARTQLPRDLKDLGPWLPKITVMLEDHRFYQHHGIDWYGSVAAIVRDLRAHRVVSGGSTITQQLVKLARGRHHRSWFAKLDETIVSWKLEHRWGKERILTGYLNRSSYGNRRLGPEAAARAYFGKSARDLTLAESVFLAGLPQAPTRFNPWTHIAAANRRYSRSLERLRQLKVISADDERLMASAPPSVRRFDPPRLAPHFVDGLVAQQRSLNGDVRTTLDLDLQETAEHLLRQHLAALNRYDISEAALVVVDNETGAVRAMVGSSDYKLSQINNAMRPRSCGSTLKPFVYLDALDRRILTAATILPDTPDAVREEYSDYDPQNYNHRFLGPVRVREALACSLNVPAVVTVSRIGARQAFFDLAKWGFRFPRDFNDYGAGFILGNAEVRLVDLAGAYAGLARRGIAMRAKLLSAEHHPMDRMASPEAAQIITDILCDNSARERSFGARSPLAFDQRIAVKTGTSSGFRDAWTVGFNQQHTVAVWSGNLDGRPMHDTFAVRSATPLWAAMMHQLLSRGDDPIDPPLPGPQLVRRDVCVDTGLVPSRFSKSTVKEWFLPGTEPTESSATCFADGQLMLSPEYAAWCRSANNTREATVRVGCAITNPLPNARFAIDPALTRHQQAIELTANLGSNVHWFINEVPLTPQPDGRYFWPLERGEWKLRAVSQNASAEEMIAVE
jgi:penicillin-binding protein 1C